MKFSHRSTRKLPKKLLIIGLAALFILLLIGSAAFIRKSYQDHLEPVSSISKTHVVTVQPGATTAEIADMLKSKGVIQSDWAFEWYVRSKNLRDSLKAGTYVVDQNQNVKEIVGIIVDGKVATDLVTIFPGKRLEETKKKFIEYGYSGAEVKDAFNPANYKNHPALTDKPKEASLEGYLYPETFQKTAETSLKDIIELSLDEMELRLTPDVRQAIASQGLTLHQGVILASIIEGEVSSPEDRAKVAQVFLKRLKEGVKLESNATDAYAKIDKDYDTYNIEALPPGPISSFTESSIQAVAFPAETDWMYFVSGDDGKTHFSKTLEDYEKNIEKFCTDLCGR